jgi:hypothetical protein
MHSQAYSLSPCSKPLMHSRTILMFWLKLENLIWYLRSPGHIIYRVVESLGLLILVAVVGCCIYCMSLVLLLNRDPAFCGTASPLFSLIAFWLRFFLDAFTNEVT